MTSIPRFLLALFIPWLVLVGGCLSKQSPIRSRYFLLPPEEEPARMERASEAHDLRLDRVSAPQHLDERMLWRLSDVEVSFDEVHCWASPPAAMVEQRLRRTLFLGDTGFRESSAVDAPRVNVVVTAFEGDIPSGTATVGLLVTEQEGLAGALRQKSFRVSRPCQADDAGELAKALGEALDDGCRQVATWLAMAPQP